MPQAPQAAEWLLLYYMNGKNNLTSAALGDFLEMAAVGSSAQVAVVAELGRPKKGNPPSFGGWSGVKRYHVQKNMVPDAASALMHVGNADAAAGDMGSPATLDDFIAWGT